MKQSVFCLMATTEPHVLPELEAHYNWVRLDETAFPEGEDHLATFTRLWREHKPVAYFTVGRFAPFRVMDTLPLFVRKLWIHLEDFGGFTNNTIPRCIMGDVTGHRADAAEPLLSVITTTFHSGHKLLRPWHSLRAQSYRNWEWIIWDDSKPDDDGATMRQVEALAAQDLRVRVYKAGAHSGVIGEMKRMSAGLARGAFIVELDHDDQIDPRLFRWLVDAAAANPDAGFFFCDSDEEYEATGVSHSYGDFYAYGFGANMRYWRAGRWHVHQVVRGLNPRTMRHLVGTPNHVRVWRTAVYDAVGKHCPALPVSDDYDLLVRTFLATKFVRIPRAAYIQFRNVEGSFTYFRNATIQHLTAWLYDTYRQRITKRFAELGVTEDATQPWQPAWHNARHVYPEVEGVYDPLAPTDRTIDVIMPTYNRAADLLRAVRSVLAQSDPDWMLFIIGDACPTLPATMDTLARELLREGRGELLETRIRWWNLEKHAHQWGAYSRNYGLKMLAVSDWVAYLDDDNVWLPGHLASLRATAAANPEARFVFCDLLVQGRVIPCKRPVFGRIDASSFMHRRDLVQEHGFWPIDDDAVYANDHKFVDRWVKAGVPWAATGQATLDYSVQYNNMSYERVLRLAPAEVADESAGEAAQVVPELAAGAAEAAPAAGEAALAAGEAALAAGEAAPAAGEAAPAAAPAAGEAALAAPAAGEAALAAPAAGEAVQVDALSTL